MAVATFAVLTFIAGTVGLVLLTSRAGMAPTLIVTNASAILVGPLLVFTAFALRSRAAPSALSATFANVLALTLGGLAGGALASFWVPYGDTDKGIYSQIGAAVTAFLSGYALSKFGPVVADRVERQDKTFLTQALLALAAFILSALAIVTHRVEWLADDLKRPDSAADNAQKEREKADVAALRAAYAASAATVVIERAKAKSK